MDDRQLDALISTGAGGYHTPPVPDLERSWTQIQRRRTTERARPARRWWRPLALAASLALAFSLGRWSSSSAPAPAVTAQGTSTEQPVTTVAAMLLGESVVLLSSLPQEMSEAQDQRFAREAGDLLLTTRVLLDAPAAQQNAALKALLEDLELVLAQVARIQHGESRAERELIRDAMQQQDLVPRIRSVAAHLAAGD